MAPTFWSPSADGSPHHSLSCGKFCMCVCGGGYIFPGGLWFPRVFHCHFISRVVGVCLAPGRQLFHSRWRLRMERWVVEPPKSNPLHMKMDFSLAAAHWHCWPGKIRFPFEPWWPLYFLDSGAWHWGRWAEVVGCCCCSALGHWHLATFCRWRQKAGLQLEIWMRRQLLGHANTQFAEKQVHM